MTAQEIVLKADLLRDSGRRLAVTAEPGHDHPDDLRTFVTITRTDAADIRERQIFARLDDGPRIALLYGESSTDEVKPGSHHLRVHNTLFRKHLRFAVEPGEHLEFIVVNTGRWWTYGIAGLLGSAPIFLRVEMRSRA